MTLGTNMGPHAPYPDAPPHRAVRAHQPRKSEVQHNQDAAPRQRWDPTQVGLPHTVCGSCRHVQLSRLHYRCEGCVDGYQLLIPAYVLFYAEPALLARQRTLQLATHPWLQPRRTLHLADDASTPVP